MSDIQRPAQRRGANSTGRPLPLRLANADGRPSFQPALPEGTRSLESIRLIDLAFEIYRSLLTSSDTRERMIDGEEPGDLHQELANRAMLAARIFYAEARRSFGASKGG